MSFSGLIACDLDQTLLADDHSVGKRTQEAVARAAECGYKFVIATGRPYNSVTSELQALGLLGKPDQYIISLNGGFVCEAEPLRVLSFSAFNFDHADTLYRFATALDVCIHVYTADTVYAYNINDDEWAYIKGRMNVVQTTETTLDFLRGQQVLKLLFENTDRAYLDEIRAQMGELLVGLNVSYSSNRYIEFNPEGVSKGVGLLMLADELKISRENTIAIGDNANDLSMIECAGIGACVANATAEVKKASVYVSSHDNNHDGVGEIIEWLLASRT